jgi:haloacetate dehalogenase
MFDGFGLAVAELDDVSIRYRIGGSGPPLLLLHGFPQNHAMWHLVAPTLSREFTVVAADLRGYGQSSAPPTTPDHASYSKRTMALDQVRLMASLGFDRFAVAGHDRGARCAYRLALDHPQRVTKLAILDVIPTYEAYARADMRFSLGYWHWFFLPQPKGMPELVLGTDLEHGYMARSCAASTPDALADYLAGWRRPEVIHAMCEDYRAGATVDYALDESDHGTHKIGCPTLVLWGENSPVGQWYDPLDVWSAWTTDVRGRSLPCGHFLPEERPDETADELATFFR